MLLLLFLQFFYGNLIPDVQYRSEPTRRRSIQRWRWSLSLRRTKWLWNVRDRRRALCHSRCLPIASSCRLAVSKATQDWRRPSMLQPAWLHQLVCLTSARPALMH